MELLPQLQQVQETLYVLNKQVIALQEQIVKKIEEDKQTALRRQEQDSNILVSDSSFHSNKIKVTSKKPGEELRREQCDESGRVLRQIELSPDNTKGFFESRKNKRALNHINKSRLHFDRFI